MTRLETRPNIRDVDTFYAELLALHDGRDKQESDALNARLVLLLANHIGDRSVLREAMRAATEASAPRLAAATSPAVGERQALFEAFARALFKRDLDALYRTVSTDFVWSYHDGGPVTTVLADRAAVQRHLEEQGARFKQQRFHTVEYHHLADVSFMTFRVTEELASTGEVREQCGIERYLFRDGLIRLKDVYRKPVGGS